MSLMQITNFQTFMCIRIEDDEGEGGEENHTGYNQLNRIIQTYFQKCHVMKTEQQRLGNREGSKQKQLLKYNHTLPWCTLKEMLPAKQRERET